MRRPGQVLSHGQLLDAAWDLGYEQRSNVVEVYVRYLRQKIDRPFGVRSLETVRGHGLPAAQGRRASVSRLPIRVRLTAALRAGDDRRARGRRAVRLRAPARRPRRGRERESAHPRGRRSPRPHAGARPAAAPAAASRRRASREVLRPGRPRPRCHPGPARAGAVRRRAARALRGAAHGRAAGSRASRGRRACWPARSGPLGGLRGGGRPVARRPQRGALRAADLVRDRRLLAIVLVGARLRPRDRRARAGRGDAPPRGRGVAANDDERLPLPAAHDEIRRLGETLNDMLDRLRRSFERERRFVADASHELRTPVAVVKTELEGALRTGDYGPRGARGAGRGHRRVATTSRSWRTTCCSRARRRGPARDAARGRRRRGRCSTASATRFADRAAQHGRACGRRRPRHERARRRAAPRPGARQPRRQRAALRRGRHPARRARAPAASTRGLRRGPGLRARHRRPGVRALRARRRRAHARGTGLGMAIVRAVAEAHGGSAAIVAGDGATVRSGCLRTGSRALPDATAAGG